MGNIKWNHMVPARQLAREAFRDPNKAHIISEEELNNKFEEESTFVAYSEVASTLLVELLTGPKLGLKASSFPSIDHEEVFTKVTLPYSACGTYAEHFRYPVALADRAYHV